MQYEASREDNVMPTNEEGEFELVLGNKQLLSVFFVAVLLLGVFFTMGYIVGRNLAPANTLTASNTKGTVIDVDSAAPKPIEVGPAPVQTPAPTPTEPVQTATVTETKPSPVEATPTVVEAPKPVATKAPEPVKAPEPAKVTPKAQETKAAETKAPAPKATPKPVEPKAAKPEVAKAAAGGSYLQVSAVTKDKVDTVLKGLNAKGFKATTQDVPGSDLIRVLVGPVAAGEMAKASSDLKAAGFASFPRKM
jgi:outer membrane biosynthesis protein TonB